jgi:hypothetical protein
LKFGTALFCGWKFFDTTVRKNLITVRFSVLTVQSNPTNQDLSTNLSKNNKENSAIAEPLKAMAEPEIYQIMTELNKSLKKQVQIQRKNNPVAA